VRDFGSSRMSPVPGADVGELLPGAIGLDTEDAGLALRVAVGLPGPDDQGVELPVDSYFV